MRRAVVAGVLPREPVDDYLYLMVRGITFSGDIEHELKADPQLLAREIWELFDPRPQVHRALIGGDRYWDAYNTWRPALVRLAQRGSVAPAVLREHALTAAENTAIGAGGRRWFKGLVRMLDDPTALPEPAPHPPPPPGNRLQKWS